MSKPFHNALIEDGVFMTAGHMRMLVSFAQDPLHHLMELTKISITFQQKIQPPLLLPNKTQQSTLLPLEESQGEKNQQTPILPPDLYPEDRAKSEDCPFSSRCPLKPGAENLGPTTRENPRLTRESCLSTLNFFTKHLLGEPPEDTMGRKNPRLSQPSNRDTKDIGQMLTSVPHSKEMAPTRFEAQLTPPEDTIPDIGSLLSADSDAPSTKGDIYNLFLHMQKLFTTDITTVKTELQKITIRLHTSEADINNLKQGMNSLGDTVQHLSSSYSHLSGQTPQSTCTHTYQEFRNTHTTLLIHPLTELLLFGTTPPHTLPPPVVP
ncbi:Hypothetical predicted protein [Pelobates cultripes]|uniref:Uncharacterized protein n=1 Tax=Pelobates cultripes TaxID=61616 RepID=A0AAD1VTX4_PELCU|nr:Hypothetical predicted protein [Pelobates cultripes]